MKKKAAIATAAITIKSSSNNNKNKRTTRIRTVTKSAISETEATTARYKFMLYMIYCCLAGIVKQADTYV